MREHVIFGLGTVEISGVDTLHCALAEGLAKLGLDVHLLSMGRAKESTLSLPTNLPKTFINPPPCWHRLPRLRRRNWTPYVSRWMNQKARDVIIDKKPTTLIAGHLGGMWLPKGSGVKQLGVIHAVDDGNRHTLKTYGKQWDACIAVNDEALELVKREVPELADKTHVIVNGVAIPPVFQTRPKQGPLRVLISGRVVQGQKRVLDLPRIIRAMNHASDVHFTIAGDGAQLEELTAQLQATLTPGGYACLGKVRHADMLNCMDKADVILSMSQYEGTPMSLMEAMARGCIPVATTGCGGAYQMLNTNFQTNIFQPGDVTAAANILDRIAKHPEQLPPLQAKARSSIENSDHTLDRMASRYAEIIHSIQPLAAD